LLENRLIGTGFQVKKKGIPEVEPTSDKEGPKKQDRVQSRANFGQGRAKKARSCPKSSQLRTRKSQKSKIVSKVEPTSDKEEPKGKNVSEVVPTSDKVKLKRKGRVRS